MQINIDRTRPSSLDMFDRFGFVDCRFDGGLGIWDSILDPSTQYWAASLDTILEPLKTAEVEGDLFHSSATEKPSFFQSQLIPE